MQSMWLVRCDCGTEKTLPVSRLTSQNHARSCGCLRNETASAKARTHGDTAGATRSTEYRIWEAMKRRCVNPGDHAYPRYGGRGITVCPEWSESFERFLADVGRRPAGGSIDRIDNDGNYEPANVRWSTNKAQSNNRRSNVRLTIDGETLTVAQWSERVGINRFTIYMRLRRGADARAALGLGATHASA